ncbi:MAG: class I SAM-dependent RNA methyltransferase [Spirochaetaceae bacterium]|nr:class I SAM-dependent RNA methyltransferase [Spirochaetaceae bacterium]
MAEGVRLKIEKLVAGGDGLAFHEGRAVFVPFSLPGEIVQAAITEERRDFSAGRVLDLIEPSPHRVEPACPVYGECGGCNLQHLSYQRQVAEKAGIVAEAFRRTARLEPGEIAAVPSLPFAYRNRLQLHFTEEGRIGFMRRSSNSVVAAPTCPVAVRPVQAWIEERAGTSRGREELGRFIVGKDRILAFGLDEKVYLEGRDGMITATVAGEPIRFHLKGFFQSNLYLLDYFVPDVAAGLSGGTVADLYCGVGLFSRFLEKRFSKVVAVEQNPFALDLARHNAPGPRNEYHALSVEDWTKGASARQDFDCVLVDPPRTGLSPDVRAWLARKRPPLLVYVSCDPVTLARDSGELHRSGYRLESLKAFDFYPQTSHVECHARFRLA